jgi:ribosome-associated protein
MQDARPEADADPPQAEKRLVPEKRRPTGERDARSVTIDAARLAAELNCTEVQVYEVRGSSPLTDYLLIASGTSDRQIKSVAARLSEQLREQGYDRLGSDRDDAATWLVLDFVELMIHLFEPATRAHYDLEMLWGDAPRIEWRPDTKS